MSDAFGDEHLGDAVSALLDGELAPMEARAARAHLDACERCRAELDATARVRSLVRTLPPVAPPHAYDAWLALGGRPDASGTARRRGALGALAAAAAAAVAVLLVADPSPEPVDPRVGEAVERHAATASAGGDPLTQFVPVAVSVRDGGP